MGIATLAAVNRISGGGRFFPVLTLISPATPARLPEKRTVPVRHVLGLGPAFNYPRSIGAIPQTRPSHLASSNLAIRLGSYLLFGSLG